MQKTLRIVSRTSKLALYQAKWVRQQLLRFYPDLNIEIISIKTEGDKIIDLPLYKVGGKGLFVKALQDYLLTGKADLAVHSIKDMPAEFPAGLTLAAILEREDPRDVFVSKRYANLSELPPHSRIGTSSLRRQSQLNRLRSDLNLQPLRGNVDTRLKKLFNQDYDALILAAAGLHRLNEQVAIRYYFDTHEILPAIGQGALGLECRAEDQKTLDLISCLNHPPTAYCVTAERSVSATLGGGCQLPLAGLATLINNDTLSLTSCVGMPDGSHLISATSQGHQSTAIKLGETVAKELLTKGADKILEACR